MRDSIIREKTFKFAVKIIIIYKELIEVKREFILSKQFVRAGTSIGANTHEALEAQSKRDFISKLSIALKEAVETEYWVKLLYETQYIDKQNSAALLSEVQEIIKILNKIIKTTKENIKSEENELCKF